MDEVQLSNVLVVHVGHNKTQHEGRGPPKANAKNAKRSLFMANTFPDIRSESHFLVSNPTCPNGSLVSVRHVIPFAVNDIVALAARPSNHIAPVPFLTTPK